MPIVYHGDHFGTKKLHPRFMYHDDSKNALGVGIYFADTINSALEYGPLICSINTDNLRLVHYNDGLKNLYDIFDKKDLYKFIKFLRKVIPKKRLRYRKNDSGKSVHKFVKKFDPRVLYDDDDDVIEYYIDNWYDENYIIYKLQIRLAHYFGLDNIEDFVNGWNKYVKIDGLFDTYEEKFCIIQTKVKVTPVNF